MELHSCLLVLLFHFPGNAAISYLLHTHYCVTLLSFDTFTIDRVFIVPAFN